MGMMTKGILVDSYQQSWLFLLCHSASWIFPIPNLCSILNSPCSLAPKFLHLEFQTYLETSFKHVDPLKAELFVTARIAPPTWGISSRKRDSGINHVVFHSSWLLIFSHKRNQVPQGAQAQKAIFRVCVEGKSFCEGKGKVLQTPLGRPWGT